MNEDLPPISLLVRAAPRPYHASPRPDAPSRSRQRVDRLVLSAGAAGAPTRRPCPRSRAALPSGGEEVVHAAPLGEPAGAAAASPPGTPGRGGPASRLRRRALEGVEAPRDASSAAARARVHGGAGPGGRRAQASARPDDVGEQIARITRSQISEVRSCHRPSSGAASGSSPGGHPPRIRSSSSFGTWWPPATAGAGSRRFLRGLR